MPHGLERATIRNAAWRLLPILFPLSLIDRVNLGFAALTIDRDLASQTSNLETV